MKECYQTENSRISPSVLSEAYIGVATHHLQSVRQQKGPSVSTGRKLQILGSVACEDSHRAQTHERCRVLMQTLYPLADLIVTI